MHFCVSGRNFTTRKSTLDNYGDNFFVSLLRSSCPKTIIKGHIFLDRNPDYFGSVLDILQHNKFHCPQHLSEERLVEELEFYGLLIPRLVPFDRIIEKQRKQKAVSALEDYYTDYKTECEAVAEAILFHLQNSNDNSFSILPSVDTINEEARKRNLNVGYQPLPRALHDDTLRASVERIQHFLVNYLETYYGLNVSIDYWKLGYYKVTLQWRFTVGRDKSEILLDNIVKVNWCPQKC